MLVTMIEYNNDGIRIDNIFENFNEITESNNRLLQKNETVMEILTSQQIPFNPKYLTVGYKKIVKKNN